MSEVATGRLWKRAVIGALAVSLSAMALVDDGTTAQGTMTALPLSDDPVDESRDFPFPGAHTMILPDTNSYITYGATAGGRKVPYTISGNGNTVRAAPRVDGDAWDAAAFPRKYWARRDSHIWTPGAFTRVKGGVRYYFLFFSAIKAGTVDKHCVGVAKSTRPGGPFRPQARPLACPKREIRWAIDADVFRGPQRATWMTWRDGQRATRATGESALSVARLRFSRTGRVSLVTTPTVILRSDNLGWPHYRRRGVIAIENPSAFYRRGSWYLFYSGHDYKTGFYATGVAYCGDKINVGRCSPMPGRNRAYFSYAGPKPDNEISGPSHCADRFNTQRYPNKMRVRGLPGNKRSPGAMHIYRARDRAWWVTWNYRSDSNWCTRKSRVGRLLMKDSGSNASFRVRLNDELIDICPGILCL